MFRRSLALKRQDLQRRLHHEADLGSVASSSRPSQAPLTTFLALRSSRSDPRATGILQQADRITCRCMAQHWLAEPSLLIEFRGSVGSI